MLGYWREPRRLSPGHADVVTCRLGLEPAAVDELAHLLEPDETARARSLRSEDAWRAAVAL